MSEIVDIKLIPSNEISSIIPLLRVLNDSISETVLHERLGEMVAQGYRCAGLYLGGRLAGVCGLWILTKYYIGKHIEPDNMIILPEYRSRNLGKKFMAWIHEYARSLGCIASELNCYVSNERGHRFWEKQGYKKIACRYQRAI